MLGIGQQKAMVSGSSSAGCFQGKVFGLTGELPRRDIEATLKSNGAQISAIIHKRVSFVVCTPEAAKRRTQKARKACKYGIPLVSSDFLKACVMAKAVVDPSFFLVTGASAVATGVPAANEDVVKACVANNDARSIGERGGGVGMTSVLEDDDTCMNTAVDKKKKKKSKNERNQPSPRLNKRRRSRGGDDATVSLSLLSSELSGIEQKTEGLRNGDTESQGGLPKATAPEEKRKNKKSRKKSTSSRTGKKNDMEHRNALSRSPHQDPPDDGDESMRNAGDVSGSTLSRRGSERCDIGDSAGTAADVVDHSRVPRDCGAEEGVKGNGCQVEEVAPGEVEAPRAIVDRGELSKKTKKRKKTEKKKK